MTKITQDILRAVFGYVDGCVSSGPGEYVYSPHQKRASRAVAELVRTGIVLIVPIHQGRLLAVRGAYASRPAK